MRISQLTIILIYGLVNFFVFIKGFTESRNKENAYGLTPYLIFLGIFTWGDAVVFGLFWTFVSLISIFLRDWYLFILVISIFWVVRSIGETIYWFNQQFSIKASTWNKPESLLWHSIFHDDSIWYIYQIIWQCITVVSIIFSIYITKLWLT